MDVAAPDVGLVTAGPGTHGIAAIVGVALRGHPVLRIHANSAKSCIATKGGHFPLRVMLMTLQRHGARASLSTSLMGMKERFLPPCSSFDLVAKTLKEAIRLASRVQSFAI